MTPQEADVVLGLLKNCITILNRQKKRDNAISSVKKAVANGSYLGRNKKRNDKAIWKLRDKGLSIRAIAKIEGISSTAVARSLQAWRDGGGERE